MPTVADTELKRVVMLITEHSLIGIMSDTVPGSKTYNIVRSCLNFVRVGGTLAMVPVWLGRLFFWSRSPMGWSLAGRFSAAISETLAAGVEACDGLRCNGRDLARGVGPSPLFDVSLGPLAAPSSRSTSKWAGPTSSSLMSRKPLLTFSSPAARIGCMVLCVILFWLRFYLCRIFLVTCDAVFEEDSER